MSDEQNENQAENAEEYESNFVTITHKGKQRKFEVREISGGLLNKLTAGLTHQDAAKRVSAVENYSTNLIAASVYEKGKKLTFDQAYALPGRISKRLQDEINKINGTSDTEEEAKKE